MPRSLRSTGLRVMRTALKIRYIRKKGRRRTSKKPLPFCKAKASTIATRTKVFKWGEIFIASGPYVEIWPPASVHERRHFATTSLKLRTPGHQEQSDTPSVTGTAPRRGLMENHQFTNPTTFFSITKASTISITPSGEDLPSFNGATSALA